MDIATVAAKVFHKAARALLKLAGQALRPYDL